MNDMALTTPTSIRIRHTMLRVADLDRSVAFYTKHLGMHVMRFRDNPKERVAYVGYGDEKSNHALELTQEREGKARLTHGTGYGHVALAVPDIEGFCDSLKKSGVPFRHELHPAPSGRLRIAFILDPDGYEVELTERV